MPAQADTSKLIKHHFGWVRDLPDHRDYAFAAVQRLPKALPPVIDLRPGCSPVEDQGNLGSCTANALVGALEFLELKDGLPLTDLSRLFVYYNERVVEHTVQSDSGAQLRDGIKSLAKLGVCSEGKWPYRISRFKAKPTPACYTEALQHRIVEYQSLRSLADMRACLADGYPFVFGFSVYESLESEQVARTGRVSMPRKNERLLGGHAVLAVGYNDRQKRFIVRNSWGTGWGLQGYFTMPYGYLADPQLASDFWVVRR